MADICTGGTASASRVYTTYAASKAFDNNTGTGWYNRGDNGDGMPEWIKYDLGAGNTKTAVQLRMNLSYVSGSVVGVKAFELQASNNDTDWTTVYSGTNSNSTGWKEFDFTSTPVAYRYWRVYITTSYYYYQVYINEIEIIEGDPISAGRAMTTNSKFW